MRLGVKLEPEAPHFVGGCRVPLFFLIMYPLAPLRIRDHRLRVVSSRAEAGMTVDELVEWLGSHACLVELEHCYRIADSDYRRRWGRAPGWLQLSDWMVARLLEEVRALAILGDDWRHLLFEWPRIAVPQIAHDLERTSDQCVEDSEVRRAEAGRSGAGQRPVHERAPGLCPAGSDAVGLSPPEQPRGLGRAAEAAGGAGRGAETLRIPAAAHAAAAGGLPGECETGLPALQRGGPSCAEAGPETTQRQPKKGTQRAHAPE